MKALLIVLVVIMLGVAPILMMNAVESSQRENPSVSWPDSPDYIACLQSAFHRECKEVEQLRTENIVLAAELARLRPAATNNPASPL